jgi:hypothetical protein
MRRRICLLVDCGGHGHDRRRPIVGPPLRDGGRRRRLVGRETRPERHGRSSSPHLTAPCRCEISMSRDRWNGFFATEAGIPSAALLGRSWLSLPVPVGGYTGGLRRRGRSAIKKGGERMYFWQCRPLICANLDLLVRSIGLTYSNLFCWPALKILGFPHLNGLMAKK